VFCDTQYLLTVDYLTNYFEVDRLVSQRMTDVIYFLKVQFARHGVPDCVFSDNQFNNREFLAFAKKYGFDHNTSSPRFPQSSGKSENAVKTCKTIMAKALETQSDPFLSLLAWRNTPSEQLEKSPVELMFGRRTRTIIPTASSLLDTESSQHTRERLAAAKRKQALYYNRNAKPKQQLPVGQTVRVKLKPDSDWHKATVEETLPYRSYTVRLEDGSTRRRTSKHVRFSPEPPIVYQDDTAGPATTTTVAPSPTLAPTPTTRSAVKNAPAQSFQSNAMRVAMHGPTDIVHNNAKFTRSGRQVVKPMRYRE
jgi:hypothetical protein